MVTKMSKKWLMNGRPEELLELGLTGLDERKTGTLEAEPCGSQGNLPINARNPEKIPRSAATKEQDSLYFAAALAIALNEPGSKLAPPTRAPSTFGQAKRAAALSGFTEPP